MLLWFRKMFLSPYHRTVAIKKIPTTGNKLPRAIVSVQVTTHRQTHERTNKIQRLRGQCRCNMPNQLIVQSTVSFYNPPPNNCLTTAVYKSKDRTLFSNLLGKIMYKHLESSQIKPLFIHDQFYIKQTLLTYYFTN